MRVVVVIGILVILLFVGWYFVFSPQQSQQSPQMSSSPTPIPSVTQTVNKQATFAIFTNGTLRIFTDERYHNKSENVYIEVSNPYIIHVKKPGITWGDFFATLPMKVTSTCLTTGTGQEFCNKETHSLKFYINNTEVSAALSREIQSQDKLLISYGPKSDPAIQNQLQQVQNY